MFLLICAPSSKHLYVISSKKWNIQTDYPMGMPVMKGGSSQINEIPTSPLQVFANKSSSSKSLKIRFPEDTPTSLEIQLIPILLMLPQWIFLKKSSGSDRNAQPFKKYLDQIWLRSAFFLLGWNSFLSQMGKHFSNFEKFRQRMNNKMFFFV